MNRRHRGYGGLVIASSERSSTMGMDDKLKHSAEGTLGKAKEKLGEATDDRELQSEGRGEQSKADLKQAGEKVKDAFKS